MNKSILNEAKKLREELIQWRRNLHAIPEIGLKLPETTAFVAKTLDGMGVDYIVCKESSAIIAKIGNGGKCFLLRSDMDALPVREESGEPFAAKNGCMHACGHDMHTTTLLGAAKLLKQHEEELNGTVKLLFQTGEEIFKGADAAIREGVLESPVVDAAFAMHVIPDIPSGMIQYGEKAMSAVYGFRIKLEGKGTHGSTPESGVDPITTGVHLHLALQELIAREVSASDEAVLTIGRFESGEAFNIIPQRAMLEGTLRTFNPEIKEKMIRRIHEVTEYVAKAYRTKAEIEVISDVPAVICDKDLNEEIMKDIRDMDETIPVVPTYHAMGSEDFALISEKVPSVYCAIGAGVEEGKWLDAHNPGVRFNEECLPTAAAIYANAAMCWLEKHSNL